MDLALMGGTTNACGVLVEKLRHWCRLGQ